MIVGPTNKAEIPIFLKTRVTDIRRESNGICLTFLDCAFSKTEIPIIWLTSATDIRGENNGSWRSCLISGDTNNQVIFNV